MTGVEHPEAPGLASPADRLQSYVAALLRNWLLVVSIVTVSTAGALIISLTSEKQYEATAKLLLNQNDAVTRVLGTPGTSADEAERDLNTHLKLVKLDAIALRVRQQLGIEQMPVAQLLDKIDDEIDGNSKILSITAHDSSPVRAARIANAFANEYRSFRERGQRAALEEAASSARARLKTLGPGAESTPLGRELAKRIEQLDVATTLPTAGGVQATPPALPPQAAASPRPRRAAIFGLLVGLLLAGGVVWLLERLDKRLHDEEAAETAFGLTVVAALPAARHWRPWAAPADDALGESYKTLASRLLYSKASSRPSPLMITSPGAGVAKTSVVVGLARALTALGTSVIVIDADLRRPRLADELDLPNRPGLSSVLTGRQRLDQALFEIDEVRIVDIASPSPLRTTTFAVLPAGHRPEDPELLLAGPAMGRLAEEAGAKADFVLIEAPPILLVSDALVLSYVAAAILLVAERGRTTENDARRAVRIVSENMAAPALGVVLAPPGPADRQFKGGFPRPPSRLRRSGPFGRQDSATRQILVGRGSPPDR